MNKYTIGLLVLLCMGVFMISCIDELDFDPPSDFQNSVTIVSKLVKGNPSIVQVRLQRLFDFSFPQEQFVNASKVMLLDEEGNSMDIPFRSTGNYYLEIDEKEFEVAVGRNYSLELCLFEGQCFKSKLEPLVGVPQADRVNTKLTKKEFIDVQDNISLKDNIEVSVSSPAIVETSDAPSNLRWEFDFTFKITDVEKQECYVSGIYFDQLLMYPGEDFANEYIDSFLILDLDVNQILTEGYHLEIVQEALSSGALKFYEQIVQLSSRNGTFYDPAPGLLTTNFENISDTPGKVFGYFYATEHDTFTTFIDSTITKSNVTLCPKPRPDCPDECCDCLDVENSTTKKPSFWPKN